jgi:hypothetical protein
VELVVIDGVNIGVEGINVFIEEVNSQIGAIDARGGERSKLKRDVLISLVLFSVKVASICLLPCLGLDCYEL